MTFKELQVLKIVRKRQSLGLPRTNMFGTKLRLTRLGRNSILLSRYVEPKRTQTIPLLRKKHGLHLCGRRHLFCHKESGK